MITQIILIFISKIFKKIIRKILPWVFMTLHKHFCLKFNICYWVVFNYEFELICIEITNQMLFKHKLRKCFKSLVLLYLSFYKIFWNSLLLNKIKKAVSVSIVFKRSFLIIKNTNLMFLNKLLECLIKTTLNFQIHLESSETH